MECIRNINLSFLNQKIISIIERLVRICAQEKIMQRPEVPRLKITTQRNCELILNLFQTYSKEEIRQRERYYI